MFFFRNFPTKLSNFLFEGFVLSKKLLLSKLTIFLLTLFNSKSNKLHDQIFWYKADHHKQFKLGSKEFWEMSKDLNSDDEEEQYDPKAMKKGPQINVKKNKW